MHPFARANFGRLFVKLRKKGAKNGSKKGSFARAESVLAGKPKRSPSPFFFPKRFKKKGGPGRPFSKKCKSGEKLIFLTFFAFFGTRFWAFFFKNRLQIGRKCRRAPVFLQKYVKKGGPGRPFLRANQKGRRAPVFFRKCVKKKGARGVHFWTRGVAWGAWVAWRPRHC